MCEWWEYLHIHNDDHIFRRRGTLNVPVNTEMKLKIGFQIRRTHLTDFYTCYLQALNVIHSKPTKLLPQTPTLDYTAEVREQGHVIIDVKHHFYLPLLMRLKKNRNKFVCSSQQPGEDLG